MAVLSLPLNFNNSFWSIGYRRGLEVLYNKLEQDVAENTEIVTFIRARAHFENELGKALADPPQLGPPGTGFNADDGASLLMAFRGLQAESVNQGNIHIAISKELNDLVAGPFNQWAQEYKTKLAQSKEKVLDGWLQDYEIAVEDIAKLKNYYLEKTRLADEAEDDAKFAPTAGVADKYTSSPSLMPRDARAPPTRSLSVSERIAKRLKEIQRRNSPAREAKPKGEVLFSAAPSHGNHDEDSEGSETEKETPSIKVDKGKGKAVDAHPTMTVSPSSVSPILAPKVDNDHVPVVNLPPPALPPIVLSDVAFPPAALSALLTRAAAELPLRPIRFPLLGEYQDCFNGEEFVAWLNENVKDFEGNLDKAEDAARDLTEQEGLLRRIGEFGNSFVHSDDAFYQFRSKAFDLEQAKAAEQNEVPDILPPLAPVADRIIKRSNTIVSMVSKALNPNSSGEPAHIRARHESEEAEQVYRVAVRKLDRHRLALEETIEGTLKTLQKWEAERLRAVKTVLLQYEGTLATLPKSYEKSLDRSSTMIAAFNPDSDLNALMERYRTGPFRPTPQFYESIAHDESDVVFGVDLRKWAEGGWSALTNGEAHKTDLVPPVLTALLAGLDNAYAKLPDDVERRKAWIYEVPLQAVHLLREVLNGLQPGQPISEDVFKQFDAPVIASTIKLWLLELDPPLALWEGWDEFRKLYPTVGSTAKPDGEVSEEQRIQDLGNALLKLPRVHLHVIDALVSHLRHLIDTTSVKESNEVFITKLALAVGRTIIRPKMETEITLQDRHPTLLFIDFIKNYDAIIPPTIARKKRESERKTPIRKRTAPIDMRLSRSRISAGADTKQLLAAQQLAQNPSLKSRHGHSGSISSVPSTPSLPQGPVPSVPTLNSPSETHRAYTPVPAEDMDLPPRPSFKEPPPEPEDDAPPRPDFKEPPPEAPSPPRPQFADPPAESAADSPTARDTQPSADSPKSGNQSPRSPSPKSDAALKASISRTPGGQQPRGPRITRGPRNLGTPGGGAASNTNRHSMASPPARPGTPPTSPHVRRLSSGTSPTRMSFDGKGRHSPRSSLSRRTMASDAEDDVVRR